MVKVETSFVVFSLHHGTILIVITSFIAYGVCFGYAGVREPLWQLYYITPAVFISTVSLIAVAGSWLKISYFLIPFMIMLLLGSAVILFKIHLEIGNASAVLATWSDHSRYRDDAIIRLIPKDDQKLYTERVDEYIEHMYANGLYWLCLFFLNTYFFIVVVSFYSELIKKKNPESEKDPEMGRVAQVTPKSNVQEPQSEIDLGTNKSVASKSNELNTNG